MSTVSFSQNMGVDLIECSGSDKKIADAARTSTKGLENSQGRVQGLVRALWREGHYSPFEHCHLTIAFHVPLFVRDQIVRHKSMSFNIQSGRYKDFEPVFYLPSDNRPLVQSGKSLDYKREFGDGSELSAARQQLAFAAAAAWSAYTEMRKAGVCAEIARAALPTSVYTGMWVTGSLRSWLHFLDQRLDEHAQYEVREAASRVADIINNTYPYAYGAWEENLRAGHAVGAAVLTGKDAR